ncbi:MAG: uracil-xanthine permease [Clostridiales bacterium]|nr:uracil-xanthine permease [Clostridiales bacterium]
MKKNLNSKNFLLGIQHLFAMFGATVLVPTLTGLNPAVALISAGIGTLIFHFITGHKVPAFLGSSFAFLAAIGATVANEGAQYAQGGIIVSGIIYLLLAVLVYLLGADRIRSFFPPIVTGPVIVVIGITLAPVAIGNIVTTHNADGVQFASTLQNWIIALIVITVIIVALIFAKGFFKLVPILSGLIAGYMVCVLFDLTGIFGYKLISTDVIKDAAIVNNIFDFKNFFTLPKFSLSSIMLIAPIALVTFMEHIGDITTNGTVVGKDFFKDPGMHRTLLGDGVATVFAGLIGGPANTTYSENTGVLAVTKVYNPFVIKIAAVFAIVLGILGKFGAVLQTIPDPVLGGMSVILFGMIAAIGMRTISDAKLDFTESRNLIIVALILVFGLGLADGIQITENISISGLFVAVLLGATANKVLPEGI